MCFRLKKIKFGQEIFYGATPDDVPYVQLSPLDEDVIVSYTGPDNGLIFAETSPENSEPLFVVLSTWMIATELFPLQMR